LRSRRAYNYQPMRFALEATWRFPLGLVSALRCEAKPAQAARRATGGAVARSASLLRRNFIPLAGVATDKIIALSRSSQLPDLHQHLHQHLHITPQQAKDAAQELIAARRMSNSDAVMQEERDSPNQ
jgi:hypothetical protein